MGSNLTPRSIKGEYDSLFKSMFGCTFDDLFRVPLEVLGPAGKATDSYFYSEESHTDSSGKTTRRINDNGSIHVEEGYLGNPNARDLCIRTVNNRLPSSIVGGSNFPPTDVYIDTDKQLVIECACAGFKEEDYGLKLEDDLLTIEFDQHTDKDFDENCKYLQKGIKSNSGTRTIYIDHSKWDAARLDHKLKDGILQIVIPTQHNYVGSKIFKTLKKEEKK